MMCSLRQARRCIQQYAGADNASPEPSASSPHECRLTHGLTELGAVMSQALRQSTAPGTCDRAAREQNAPGTGVAG